VPLAVVSSGVCDVDVDEFEVGGRVGDEQVRQPRRADARKRGVSVSTARRSVR
jgi:hypothetical protein